MVVPFFSLLALIEFGCGSGRGEEPSGERSAPPDSDPINNAKFEKKFACWSREFAARGAT
jgi:hypothetical protein